MDNLKLTNPDETVNKFDAYFINIGRSLSDHTQFQRSGHEYLQGRPQDLAGRGGARMFFSDLEICMSLC